MKFYLSKVLIIFILIFPLLVFAYNSQGFGNRDSEPYIDNLNPDSLATGVAVNTNIEFDIHDSDGILIDSISVIIIENDNQDFHNYSTALGNLGENVVSDSLCEITIDPQTIFRYCDTIFVNVRALDVLENEMNVTYWFKCMEDNDSPYIYPGSLSPSNEEINVSLGTNIEFGIRDQGGAGVSLSTIVVKVNETFYNYEHSGIFSYELAGTGFNITVNPTNNFNFGDSVNIEINANDLAIPPNSMTILSYFICASENTSPTAVDFSIYPYEDVAIVIPFSDNSSDYEGQTLSYEVVDGPYHGTYSNSIYTPDLNYNGIDSDSLDYVAFDGALYSDTATVFISVYPVNDAPLAGAGDDFEAFEGTEVTLDGSASYDIDEDTITYLWSGELADLLDNDTLATPTFTAPEVVGDSIYTFYLMVYDGEYYSELDEVIITIFNVNQPPIANAGEDQEVDEGTFVTLDGSGSSDPDEDDLTYAWTALEGVMLNDSTLSNPVFIAPSVSGETDLFFVLIVNDGEYDSEPDTVIITVRDIENYPPNIADLSVSTLEDISVEIIFTGTDPDGDTLTFAVVDSPTNGIYADSVYTPNENYFGDDSFTYRAYDGTDSSDVATVFITITSVDDAIIVTELLPAEFTQIINETETINFSITASDPDGNELIYSWKLDDVEVSAINSYNFTTDYTSSGYYSVTLDVTDNYGRDALSYQWNVTVTDIDQDIVVTELLPAEFTQTINEIETINFSITASDPDGNGLSYVWKLDDNVTSVNSIYDFVTDYEWSGSYVVTLEVSDNFNRSTLAYTWNVTVNNVNRIPVVENMAINTGEDTAVEIIFTGTDPDGDTLTFAVVDSPTNGIYADSVYTPNENYFGDDSFTYRAYDGTDSSDVATVFITITSVDDEIEVTELLPAEFTQIINETETINFSITASDPDGNDLSYIWKLNEVEVSTESTFNFITDNTSAGYYAVTLEVMDNYSKNSLSYTWDIAVLSDEKVILDPHTVPEDASCEIIVITTQSTDKITCKIFNRRGKLIKVLDVQEDKTTTWDKKDKNGRPVPGGFYIYQVKIDEKIYQGSIIIVR
ncbi:MAG: tandem-95 repeat protein [Candidatus Cloacimonetes bacterium]|nr:tandem-95 repeat protein [Candidatus Cloacimonadota bacterium]